MTGANVELKDQKAEQRKGLKKAVTAYDKILVLMRLSPNANEMRTALRHFPDSVLLRELQRRDAMPDQDTLGHWRDSELQAEYDDRGLGASAEAYEHIQNRLREALRDENWHTVREALELF